MPESPSENLSYWRMGGITQQPVEDYLYSMLPPRDAVLAEMEAFAAEHHVPIVGPAVALFFDQLARMIGAKTVFEMGSAIGYSTIWWARAIGDGGVVHYTDGDPAKAERAQRYFERAGVSSRIQVHVGDALEVLQQQPGPFDIIFNDVDKTGYPAVLPLVGPKLRSGGLFVTDNVLWSGRVALPEPRNAETQAILQFNRELYASTEFRTTLIPLRDGLAVALKK